MPKGSTKTAAEPTSKAFGLLMGKRLKVVMKKDSDDDGAPVIHEGTLRSFDEVRIILEDDFVYTPLTITEIASTNIQK